MEDRHQSEPRVDRSRLELLALLGSAGAAAACSGPAPEMIGSPSSIRDIPPEEPSKPRRPLTPEELKSVGLDKEGGGGGGGDGGGH